MSLLYETCDDDVSLWFLTGDAEYFFERDEGFSRCEKSVESHESVRLKVAFMPENRLLYQSSLKLGQI